MRTAAHSSPWVELVDEDQYTTGEGPCIDAIHRATVISLKDLDDPRYPRFCTRAREEGLGSVLALPLTVNDRTVGALNLYSREPDAFDADAQDLARNFAAQAAIALVNIELYEGATKLNDQLNEAMDSRAVIEQAKGILMGREHCDADQAFELLKAMSQTENVKVREVATLLVGEGGSEA
jgi:GAF domain-containing protein